MGLTIEVRSSGKFVNFKEGMLINNGQSFTHIEGVIKDMSIQPEVFKGKEYQKVTLFIVDNTGFCYHLGFPMVSGYGLAFFAISPNIDFSKPVKISGGSDKMPNGNSFGKMFVQQNGAYVKWFFKKDSEAAKKIPAIKEVKVGKEIVKDYEKRDEFIEKSLTKVYKDKIMKAWPAGITKSEKEAKPLSPADGVTEPIDDMPF